MLHELTVTPLHRLFESDYISDQKRVRLVMQVFLGVQTRSESLAVCKFTVWWHFIQCLEDRVAGLFEQVL
jgi:hypothetical protein